MIALSGCSQSGATDARGSLAALTPLLPNLRPSGGVVISDPSCDAYPPCTSAAQAWSPTSPTTLRELDRAVTGWASHNHLRGSNPRWTCGPNAGLFGVQGPGCQATLAGPDSYQSVFIATTFTAPAAVSWDPATEGRNALADPLSVLATNQIATLAVQVVTSSR